MSGVAVGKWARSHGWPARVAALDNRVQRKAEDRVVRDRAARIARTVELVDLVREGLIERLQNGDGELLRLGDFPALAKLEALLEGEATSRVELPEVQEAWRLGMDAAVRVAALLVAEFVPEPQRPAALSRFRALLPQAMYEAFDGLAARAPLELEAGDTA